MAACSLAYQLKAKTITLAGQDLSFSGANYFVAGPLNEKSLLSVITKYFWKPQRSKGGRISLSRSNPRFGLE